MRVPLRKLPTLVLFSALLSAGCAKKSETNQGNPPPIVNIQPNEPALGTTIEHPNGPEELVIPLREVSVNEMPPAPREVETILVAPRELEFLMVAPRELDVDLTNEDTGLERLPLNFDIDRAPDVSVPVAVDPTKPVGIGQSRLPLVPEVPGDFKGRTAATRAALLRENDGNTEVEAAIANALVWIAKQQKPDGSWEYEGTQKSEKVAATAMAVLAFLGTGETHKDGKKYKTVVAKGLQHLQKEMKPTGQMGSGMYAHALGAIALCEAYGMTRDAALKAKAQLAINFIVKAQGNDGGWRYAPNSPSGDTSVFGWQLQALKSAQLAGLTVPKACLQKAEKFLDTVASDDASQFGYTAQAAPTQTLSAVGLLAKLFLGTKPDNDAVKKGVKTIWNNGKPDKKGIDTYYLWYGTLLFQQVGGDVAKDWTPALRKALLEAQVTEKTPNAKPADVGSWRTDFSHIGSSCGRLGTTCMSALCLEVSYRHLPITKRDGKPDEAK